MEVLKSKLNHNILATNDQVCPRGRALRALQAPLAAIARHAIHWIFLRRVAQAATHAADLARPRTPRLLSGARFVPRLRRHCGLGSPPSAAGGPLRLVRACSLHLLARRLRAVLERPRVAGSPGRLAENV